MGPSNTVNRRFGVAHLALAVRRPRPNDNTATGGSVRIDMSSFEVFEPLTIDEAPDCPGLYAWFPHLGAGAHDWKMHIEDGQDVGAVSCQRLIQRQSSSIAAPTISLSGSGTFSSQWKGELRDETGSDLSFFSSDSNTPSCSAQQLSSRAVGPIG